MFKKKKRIPLHKLSYDKMRKRGKVFGGKRYKYLCHVPDAQHQGKIGYIDEMRRSLIKSGASVRTIRTTTGWDVYERRPWYRSF